MKRKEILFSNKILFNNLGQIRLTRELVLKKHKNYKEYVKTSSL